MKEVLKKIYRGLNAVLARFNFRLMHLTQIKNFPYERVALTSGYLRLNQDLMGYLTQSRSQFGQDWLVVSLMGERRGAGYFVEFGAVNGVFNSNSYYFEKALGWRGIVSEPARKWHDELRQNRACAIEERCVYGTTGQSLEFIETGNWKGGNTLLKHKDDDGTARIVSDRYAVETVSLADMLEHHKAPNFIEFISIDTEGSEFEILKPFDFKRWQFGLMVIEHNFEATKRQNIRALLEENGYHLLPIDPEITDVDDWYADAKTYAVYVERYGKGQ